MTKRKINLDAFKDGLEFRKTGIPGSYQIDIETSYNTSNEFGRARGVVVCPCCNNRNTAYWWSLAGSGKRCERCGTHLTWDSAIVSEKRLKKKDIQRFKEKYGIKD